MKAILPCRVVELELVHGDLADDGVDHILHLARQQGFPFGGGFRLIQQAAEGQHFAKDRGGFGQSEGR